MRIRTTQMDPELAVVTPHKDSNNIVNRYEYNSYGADFTDDGTLAPRPDLYMPSRGSGTSYEGDDVFDYEEYTETVGGKKLTLLFSRRCGIVARVRYGETDEMSQVDTGQEFGDAELHRYNLRTEDEIRYNPTMGGAIDPEFGRWHGNRYVRHLHGSPVKSRRWYADSKCLESTTIPLHFGGEYGGREGGRPWHGGDEWFPAIFPRMRMKQRTYLHYNGLPGVIRHDFLSLLPIAIARESSTAISSNTSWWRPGPTPPPKLFIPGEPQTSLDLSSVWLDEHRAEVAVLWNRTTINNQPLSDFKPSEPGGLVAFVCESPEPGRPAFGGVSRVFAQSSDLIKPTEFMAFNRMSNGNWERHDYLPPENRNAGHHFSSRSRANGRVDGWVENRSYWVFGDSAAEVEQSIHAGSNLLKSPDWWPESWKG